MKPGQIHKLVANVERITFAADYARQHPSSKSFMLPSVLSSD